MISTLLAAAATASPVPGDAAFAMLSLHGSASHIAMCIGKRYQGRPLVAFIFRRDAASYVRVAIIRTRASFDGTSCPQASADLAIPDLPGDATYVLGLYALPEAVLPAASGTATARAVTVGAPSVLEPILYVGLHIEK